MIRNNNHIVFPEKPQALSGIHRVNASRGLAALLLPLALLAAPAAAQVNPGCTGSNPGTIDCPFGDYSGTDGISHTSNGDLQLNIDMGESDGDRDTTPNTTNVSNYENGGVVTTAGNLNDNLSLFVTGNYNNNGFSSQNLPVLFDVQSQAGDIDFMLDPDVDDFDIGAGSNTTFARFESTAGGDITATFGSADGASGISGAPIEASTTGEGSIQINVGAGGLSTGIDASTQDGDITLLFNETLLSGDIHTDTTGTGVATVTLNDVNLASAGTRVLPVGSRAILNITGAPVPDESDVPVPAAVDFELEGLPETPDFDFSGLTDGGALNLENAAWVIDRGTSSAYAFSSGDDVVTLADKAAAHTPFEFGHQSGNTPLATAVIDFGAGDDTVSNAGLLFLGPGDGGGLILQGVERIKRHPTELRFDNLETFEHAGAIFLGANFSTRYGRRPELPGLLGTDNWHDDVLRMPGTQWVGQGGHVVMDVDLTHTLADGQTGCDESLRNADDDLPSADCIDLRDGGATGETLIEIGQGPLPGDRGAYNPEGFVLVDLASDDPGEIEPGAFVLSPNSRQYNPRGGGFVDKGLLGYFIGYDAETQQFKLYGVEAPAAQQAPLLAHAANELWRTGAGAWFSRQADQRDVDADAGLGGGAWGRIASTSSDRDLSYTVPVGSGSATFDNSYSQDNTTVTLGLDFISRRDGGSAWVIGGMIGYAQADVELDNHPNTADLEGMQAGVYGSFTHGAFFLDAAVNGNWLDMHVDVPAMDLQPEGTVSSTDLDSLGAQVEGGWRLTLGRLGIEPLASLSYVRTSFESLSVPADDPSRFGAEVRYDDPTSFRGGLGVRLSVDNLLPNVVPTGVSLTARAIEEFDGESNVSIVNAGPVDMPVANTFDGTFGQVTGSVNVSNTAKTAVGYLSVDGTFGDDYESTGFEAGFRYQW